MVRWCSSPTGVEWWRSCVLSRPRIEKHRRWIRGTGNLWLLRPAAAPGSLDWSSVERIRLRGCTSQDLLDAEREE